MALTLGKIVALLFILIVTIAFYFPMQTIAITSNTDNSWVEKAPLHIPRANLGVATVNGYIYAIGGNDIGGVYNFDQGFSSGTTGGILNTVERYDPSSDNWTQETSMPIARDSFAIAAYKDSIYCIGGRISIPYVKGVTDNAISNVNQMYNTTSKTWLTKTPIPIMEYPLQACVLNDTIYVIGVSGTYAYNPLNDSWAEKTSAPYINSIPDFVLAVLKNMIYVVGLSGVNMIYDPSNDTWNLLHSSQPYSDEGLMGYGLFSGVASATTGILSSEQLYVFFGDQTYVYSEESDSWISAKIPSNERFSYGIATINDTFFIIGGGSLGEGFFAPYAPSNKNEQYLPFGYGIPDPVYVKEHSAPLISILSPLHQTYNVSSMSLILSIDKSVNWVGYNLDGKQNITITPESYFNNSGKIAVNITIAKLTEGTHDLRIFANDTFGNVGFSKITFETKLPPDFPVLPVIMITFVIIVFAAAFTLFAIRHKIAKNVRSLRRFKKIKEKGIIVF